MKRITKKEIIDACLVSKYKVWHLSFPEKKYYSKALKILKSKLSKNILNKNFVSEEEVMIFLDFLDDKCEHREFTIKLTMLEKTIEKAFYEKINKSFKKEIAIIDNYRFILDITKVKFKN